MDTPTPKKNRKRLLAAVTIAFALPTSGLLWAAAASADDEVDAVAAEVTSCESVELTPEEIATFQADEEALAAALDAAGIEHSWSEPEDGIRYVEWDWYDDEANDAVEDFWALQYPLTSEDVAELNEEADGLAAHLEAKAIDHTVDTDAAGVRTVEWDYDDEAANTVVDEYYQALYPLTAEDVAAMNADADALAAHLQAKAIEHTVQADEEGVRYVEWDYEDDAANDAVDEYYESSFDEEDAVAC